MIRPRFVSVRTAMTIAYTVERQTSIMGSKAMAHEFRKSLMTAAPQGLVSDGSYGNGLPHCYQIASNLRSIYRNYSPLNSVSRKRTLQQSSNSFLFCRPTQGLVRTNVLGTLLQRVRLQALDLRKALDLGMQS